MNGAVMTESQRFKVRKYERFILFAFVCIPIKNSFCNSLNSVLNIILSLRMNVHL